MTADLAALASRLRALHRAGTPVVLPNAWDAGSARAVEAAGYPAVATSSAAVAESLGYSDREAAPVHEMLDAVARIVHAVNVPVTADLERGYNMTPVDLVERLAATGAVGCNLEDSDPRTRHLIDVDEQAAFLGDVRAAARSAGLDLVINARVDTYVADTQPDDPLDDAVRRSRAYLHAGADCVYPITASDRGVIRHLIEQAHGPVNILYRPGKLDGPTIAELAELGVARISLGPGLYRAVHARLCEMLTDIQTSAAASR